MVHVAWCTQCTPHGARRDVRCCTLPYRPGPFHRALLPVGSGLPLRRRCARQRHCWHAPRAVLFVYDRGHVSGCALCDSCPTAASCTAPAMSAVHTPARPHARANRTASARHQRTAAHNWLAKAVGIRLRANKRGTRESGSCTGLRQGAVPVSSTALDASAVRIRTRLAADSNPMGSWPFNEPFNELTVVS
jgi:hypothetical protein